MRKLLIATFLVVALLFGFQFSNNAINFNVSATTPYMNPTLISTYNTFNAEYPFIHKTVSIRLNDEIKSVNAYKDVAEAISALDYGDTAKIYLSGYGGDVMGTTYIINALVDAKADTETHIVGPVYSGHAYISLYGKKIFMNINSYLMLHVSSIFELDCSRYTGKDRAISMKESCQNLKNAALFSNFMLLYDSHKLTKAEILHIMSGHELYLFADTMYKRGAVIQ